MNEKKWLNSTDLDCNYTTWQVEKGLEYTLPPLSLDKELFMIKNKNGVQTKVAFKLFEFQNLLIFNELISGKKYGFDTTDATLGKIYFRLETGEAQTWKRLWKEPVND